LGDTVQHENYKGISIRSSPFAVSRHEQQQWIVRLDITFPTGGASRSTAEYLNARLVYLTSKDAHLAGLEWGHRIVDLWQDSGQIPQPELMDGLLGP